MLPKGSMASAHARLALRIHNCMRLCLFPSPCLGLCVCESVCARASVCECACVHITDHVRVVLRAEVCRP